MQWPWSIKLDDDTSDAAESAAIARTALEKVRSVREETRSLVAEARSERASNHFGTAVVDALRSRRDH